MTSRGHTQATEPREAMAGGPLRLLPQARSQGGFGLLRWDARGSFPMAVHLGTPPGLKGERSQSDREPPPALGPELSPLGLQAGLVPLAAHGRLWTLYYSKTDSEGSGEGGWERGGAGSACSRFSSSWVGGIGQVKLKKTSSRETWLTE